MKLGIVGLPNVGKSTLFNAITAAGAECANYPFCTIEPNKGVVAVPDERVDKLAAMYKSKSVVHATVEFVDIAGLVKGASKGEGLGNKFLSHIRETDAIVHVVRCFENGDITHVEDTVDPVRDMEVNLVNRSVKLAGKDIKLTAKEFDLLQLFITNRGRVFSRESMLETVWKYDYLGDMRTVDVHIRRLREKIERNNAQPEFIFTKWGVGYYFTDKD